MIVSDLLTLTEDLFLSFRLQAYHEVLRLAWVVHIFIWGEHKSQVSCLCIIILALRLQHLVHTAALWTFFQVYLALSASTLHVRAGNAPVSADSTPLGCCTALRWLSERWLHKPGETGSLFNHIREREREREQTPRSRLHWFVKRERMSYRRGLEVIGLTKSVHPLQRISTLLIQVDPYLRA